MESKRYIYKSRVLRVGPEVKELMDGGVAIFFADPVPEALEQVSIVHAQIEGQVDDINVGDAIYLNDSKAIITAVGERAMENIRQLGHMVVYLDGAEEATWPGAINASGKLELPKPGDLLAIIREN